MKKYSVVVSSRLTKMYDIEADCKESAMAEALDYYNEFATIDYAETDVVSDIFVDAEELYEEENATEE
ncbi:MAG: hypothetical protein IK997_07510 [Bacilli bacterium]|nr:hypothetical protein [Bacilli bacterium]